MVPVDFSELSVAAIQHAMIFAKTTGHGIVLAHIVNKPAEIPAAQSRLNEFAEKMKAQFNTQFFSVVKAGDLYKGIKTASIEMNAMIIVIIFCPGNELLQRTGPVFIQTELLNEPKFATI